MAPSTYQKPWAGPVRPYAQLSPVLNHCGELGAAIWLAQHVLELVFEGDGVLGWSRSSRPSHPSAARCRRAG